MPIVEIILELLPVILQLIQDCNDEPAPENDDPQTWKAIAARNRLLRRRIRRPTFDQIQPIAQHVANRQHWPLRTAALAVRLAARRLSDDELDQLIAAAAGQSDIDLNPEPPA